MVSLIFQISKKTKKA